VLARPTCRRLTAALPRSPLFVPHPTAAHRDPLSPGPTCQLCRTTSPMPHRPPLFASPPPSRARRPEPSQPHAPSFSPSPSAMRHARANTPLLLCLLAQPPTSERAATCGISTAPAPSSPAPMRAASIAAFHYPARPSLRSLSPVAAGSRCPPLWLPDPTGASKRR
jgi:hypothetical protein